MDKNGTDLSILINAVLNEELSKTTIKKQLQRIQSDPKFNRLKLNIQLDTKALQSLNNFAEQFKKIEGLAKNTGKVITETLSPDGTKMKITSFDGVPQEIQKTIAETKKLKQSLDDVSNTQMKDANLVNQQISLRKQLVSLYTSGKNITKEQLVDTAKLVNTADSASIKQAKLEIDRLRNVENIINKKEQELQYEQRINDTINKRNIQRGELIGSSDSLKNLKNSTEQTVVETLKLNKALREQDVIASSLNTVTGAFSVTLKDGKNKQKVIKGQVDSTTGSIYKQSEAIQDVSNRYLTLGKQFSTAFSKSLIWGASMTAIYGTQNAIQLMVEEIYKVDSAMTELKRVMDATPMQYNDMLQSSIDLSKDLGNNVHDVLTSLGEVARSYGDVMSQSEMLELTKVSTIASNISDLSNEDAMKNLIGTLNAYKMEVSDAITVVDAMNEVDNSFSISTQQLSDSLSRAAVIGSIYGASLQEVLGHTTAIGAVTMESGDIIGKIC